MIDRLPGTTIEIAVPNAEAAKSFLDNAFICGGLMMSQVARLTGLEPYIIQNWVKRGFLPPPQKKLYTQRRNFSRCATNQNNKNQPSLQNASRVDFIVLSHFCK